MTEPIEAVGGGPIDGQTFDPDKCGPKIILPAGIKHVHLYQLTNTETGTTYRYHGEIAKGDAAA
jgi:hypothetical protein